MRDFKKHMYQYILLIVLCIIWVVILFVPIDSLYAMREALANNTGFTLFILTMMMFIYLVVTDYRKYKKQVDDFKRRLREGRESYESIYSWQNHR